MAFPTYLEVVAVVTVVLSVALVVIQFRNYHTFHKK